MTDRERIAAILIDAMEQGYLNPLEMADAILAAIGDRLLPELTDNFYAIYGEAVTNTWHVTIYDDHPDSYSGPGYRVTVGTGTGPTIPAAIRNALATSTTD